MGKNNSYTDQLLTAPDRSINIAVKPIMQNAKDSNIGKLLFFITETALGSFYS